LLTDGVTPEALFIDNWMVPSPLPVFTVTVQLVPEPVTLVTYAPVTPERVIRKSPEFNPLTDEANVAVKVNVVALVGLVVVDVSEVIVVLALFTVPLTACVAVVAPPPLMDTLPLGVLIPSDAESRTYTGVEPSVPVSGMEAVEPQVELLELTSKPVGAVAVKLPVVKLDPDIEKLVDDPAVPAVVLGTVVVPPGTVMVGCTTLKVVEAPEAAAEFPARSVAVPEAMEMPSVPTPVMLEIVTVYDFAEPDNATVPLALPVLFKVIFPSASVLPLKFASAYITL
jgi:hypothetical protein